MLQNDVCFGYLPLDNITQWLRRPVYQTTGDIVWDLILRILWNTPSGLAQEISY